jgi:hypothetical protein
MFVARLGMASESFVFARQDNGQPLISPRRRDGLQAAGRNNGISFSA